MTFDQFKQIQNEYRKLSKGVYDRKTMPKVYKYLPTEFKVSNPSKNERTAAIKAYFEHVFIPAMEKLFPNGYSGQTSSQKSE